MWGHSSAHIYIYIFNNIRPKGACPVAMFAGAVPPCHCRVVPLSTRKRARFFHGWKYLWGYKSTFSACLQTDPFAGTCVWELSSDKCTEETSVTTAGERNYFFFRHVSGFWLPGRAPHKGGSSTDGVRKDVRGLLACAEAVACLQAEIMSTPDMNSH